jgi:hypothetical protein
MPTIHRVAIESTMASGAEVVNTFHLRVDEALPFEGVTSEQILDQLEDQLIPTYRILHLNTTTVERIRLATEKDPLNPADVSVGGVRELGVPGGMTVPGGTNAPRELCLVASLRSGLLGRSFRGHMFLPPMNDADDCDGELINANATYYGAALGLAEVLRLMRDDQSFFNLFAPTVGLVVYSRTRRLRGLEPWFTPVTAVAVTRRLHWLRSRAS